MSFSILQICTSHSFLDQWSFANRLPVPKKEIRTTLEKFLVFFSNQVQPLAFQKCICTCAASFLEWMSNVCVISSISIHKRVM